MKYKTSEIRDGKYIGDIVWVCSYNQPDINKKPLRNVPPTKCIIEPIEKTNKRVYYSETYFCPLNKNDEPTKKVISPVDNTGYRSYCGNEIDVFSSEKECVSSWNEQLKVVSDIMEKYAEDAYNIWTDKSNELKNKII